MGGLINNNCLKLLQKPSWTIFLQTMLNCQLVTNITSTVWLDSNNYNQYQFTNNFPKQNNQPPLSSALAATYSKLSMEITSMMGDTTLCGSSWTLCSNGSNQPLLHSTCESRKVRTGAVARSAPLTLERIRPTVLNLMFNR